MKQGLPVKRLNRLSFLLSGVIGFIFYIIVSRNSQEPHIYIFTLFTVLGITLVGYLDVGVMLLLSGRYEFQTRKFRQARWLITYPLSIIIYFLLWPLIARLANEKWSYDDVNLFLAFIGSGLVINTTILLLHDSVLLYEHKLYSELELSRLRAANAEATNLLLRQQIQPHFLFNAMNTVKALYNKDTQKGDIYIVHMANFLRASIFHHSSNTSSVKDEIELLGDYLAMQRIRFGKALDCTITLTDDTLKDYYLPSFSLQPLLENAIKHNSFTQLNPIKITIIQTADRLVFSNTIQKKNVKVASTNYGLANLAERYRLLSGDEIIIKKDQDTFSVSIKLLKDEYSNH